MMEHASSYSLPQLAELLGAELRAADNTSDIHIESLAVLTKAGPGQLTFLSRADYARYLPECRASAVIVSEQLAVDCPVPQLRVKNPYLAYAKVSALFDRRPLPAPGIHASAIVDPTARIAASASIGARAVIEANVVIGEHSVIGPGSVVGAGSQLGHNVELRANATLYHGVILGDRVLVHSSTVIGSDGFGFAPKPGGGWQKIHQLGTVRIGNDVEIGANTTIDRGAIEDTVIEEGVIIDNQVQIAHNVHIGRHTAIAACTGIAGSTRIGANCTIAGAVGIVGHINIADSVHITAMTLVTGSIDEAGSYSSGTNLLPTKDWRRSAVRFGQLDELAKRVKALEKNNKE